MNEKPDWTVVEQAYSQLKKMLTSELLEQMKRFSVFSSTPRQDQDVLETMPSLLHLCGLACKLSASEPMTHVDELKTVQATVTHLGAVDDERLVLVCKWLLNQDVDGSLVLKISSLVSEAEGVVKSRAHKAMKPLEAPMKKAKAALQASISSDSEFMKNVDSKALSSAHMALVEALETVKGSFSSVGVPQEMEVKTSFCFSLSCWPKCITLAIG